MTYGEGARRSQTDRLLEGNDLWLGGPVRAEVFHPVTRAPHKLPRLPLGVHL